jgi:O-antigen/teichoic acid export membrane protein
MICQAVIAVLLPIMALGLDGAIQRYYVEFEEPIDREQFIFTVISFIVFVGLLLIGIIELVGGKLAGWAFQSVPYQPYLRLAVWASFLKLLTVPSISILRIQERAVPFSLIVYGGSAAKLALSVWFVAGLGRGVVGALEGILWGNALVLPVCLYVVYRNSVLEVKTKLLHRALMFGLPLIPHNLAHWIMALSDRMVLENYASMDEVGAYSLGYQLAQGAGLTIGAINGALTPYMINRYQNEGRDALFGTLSTYFVSISVVLVMGVILFGRYAVHLIARPGYYSAIEIIAPVAVGYLFLALYHVPNTYLTIAEKTRLIAASSITAALVNVGLNLWLVPLFGMHAAAWSTLAAYVLLFAGVFAGTRNLDVANYEFGRLAKVLVAGSVLVGGYYVALRTIDSYAVGFGTAVVLFVAFPLVLAGMKFYSSREVAFARRSVRRLLT